MANTKRAIITDEEAAKNSIEELDKTESTTIEDEIEKAFGFEPLQVTEVPKKETSVEVMPIKDWTISWAGTWYYAIKGKPIKVPIDMRDQLLKNKQQPKIKDIW
jgi:hypothetical protein